MAEVGGDVVGGDVGGGVDPVIFFEPSGEGFEGGADGELVVGGQATLGGEVEDEAVDGALHGWGKERDTQITKYPRELRNRNDERAGERTTDGV